MANLIPPEAKKAIVTEYWFRVGILWSYMVGIGILIVALLKGPALWAIESQLGAYSGAFDSAQEKAETIKESQLAIQSANELAGQLAAAASTTPPTEVLAALDQVAGRDVSIASFRLTKGEKEIETITITGMANTRTALANFRADIESNPLFQKADLPISNLAKESDIPFNIEITPSKE